MSGRSKAICGRPTQEGRADQASVCFHVGESKGWQCAMRPAEHEAFKALPRGSQKQITSGDQASAEDYDLGVEDVHEGGDPYAEPVTQLVE